MDADLKDEFSMFPEEVKRQLLGAISHQTATSLGMKPEVSFKDHIRGLPNDALEWLIKFETDLLEYMFNNKELTLK